MLDIVATYADNWKYQLNAGKSSVMVLGESATTRLSAHSFRKWYIGQEEISETDSGGLRQAFIVDKHCSDYLPQKVCVFCRQEVHYWFLFWILLLYCG